MQKRLDSGPAISTVDERRILELEQRSIRIPSSTFEEGEIADLYASRMADIGLDVEMMEVIHPQDPAKKSRQPIGRLRGTGGGPTLMLNGHMDPGAEMTGWTVDPLGAKFEDGWIWGIGAHVLKTGLGPVMIDLMERGFVSAIATNGAAVIHDFEVALAGATSEDVDQSLGPGTFGMAEETGRLLNAAINDGVAKGLGIGQAVSRFLHEHSPQHARSSLLAAAGRLGVPVTVHVAIGTDIIHMHPAASGAALGEGSLRDFRYFVANVARLERGVFLNCGSAVVLPEVFLKAVAVARNQGIALAGLTTVNMDFIRSYRPQTNVVSRPTAGTEGKGYSLVGHHEIMIPLLAAAILHAAAE